MYLPVDSSRAQLSHVAFLHWPPRNDICFHQLWVPSIVRFPPSVKNAERISERKHQDHLKIRQTTRNNTEQAAKQPDPLKREMYTDIYTTGMSPAPN